MTDPDRRATLQATVAALRAEVDELIALDERGDVSLEREAKLAHMVQLRADLRRIERE